MTLFNLRASARNVTLSLSLLASVSAFAAGKTVPGEKWQQNITVQMEGMSMPMGNTEICAPVGKPTELLKPDKNCSVSNYKQSGNKMSADVKCTGKDAMQGSIEQIIDGNRIHGTAHMRSSDGEMTMKMESQKLGACQAVDIDDVVATGEKAGAAAVKAAGAATAKYCTDSAAELQKSPQRAGALSMAFAMEGGQCVTTPPNASFCAAVQTRGGFSSLAAVEQGMGGITGKSLAACGLGQGKAAVDALRTRLIASAEAEGDSDFLQANAPARLKQLARTQCVQKGEMWAGRSPKWDRFCDSDAAEAARH
jgi:hypothetical protein